MNKLEIFERIFADQPSFHHQDETIDGSFRAARSALPVHVRNKLAAMTGHQNHGVSKGFGRYLLDAVQPNMRTLETGAGISTLIFAMGGSQHIAVAPWNDEMDEFRKYGAALGIDTSRIEFVASPSEKYLPTMTTAELDIVFIDGKHAFPWPVLDWYYTADRLKVGGLMMIDDTQIRSVGMLSEFLKSDSPRWQFVETAGERTDVFRKLAPSVHDVAWHEQPWLAGAWQRPLLQRVKGRLTAAISK